MGTLNAFAVGGPRSLSISHTALGEWAPTSPSLMLADPVALSVDVEWLGRKKRRNTMLTMMRMARVGLLATGAVLGAVVGVTAHLLSGPSRPELDYDFTPFEIGVPAENVTFTTADGIQIAGWWFDDQDADTVVICCAGHRGSKSNMLGIGPGLHKRGNAVLLFDFRGNGESADGPQSLGHHERLDLRAAVDWVSKRRPETRIVVVAYSMGAAVAVQEAAEDERIAALVADSPFATMSEVVAANFRRHRLPLGFLVPVVSAWTALRYGYHFEQVRPIDAIGRISPRPVLLLHGTEDRVIPFEHSQRMAAVAKVPLVAFEGADHCGGYFQDRPAYLELVARFLHDPSDIPGSKIVTTAAT